MHMSSVLQISGAKIVFSATAECVRQTVASSGVGTLRRLDERTIGYRKFIVMEGEDSPVAHKSEASIVVSAPSQPQTLIICHRHKHACEELEWACRQAMKTLSMLLIAPYVLPGAGCFEIHLAHFIRHSIRQDSLIYDHLLKAKFMSVLESVAQCVECLGILSLSSQSAQLTTSIQSTLTALRTQNRPTMDRTYLGIDSINQATRDPDVFFGHGQCADDLTATSIVMRRDSHSRLVVHENDKPVLDLLISKKSMIRSALDTAVIILRIDKILV